MIAAYLLDGRGGGEQIDWQQVSEWTPDRGLLWVHLDYTHGPLQEWLLRGSGLEEVTARALIAEETRPRAVFSPEGLLVILRGVNTNPGEDPEDMVSIRVWLEERRIITCRMRRLLSIEDIREAIAEGRGPATPGEFLTQLTERLVARIGDFSAGIQDSIDELEDEVLATESRALRTRLATARRKVIELRRYLSPQRDALNRLVADRPALLGELNNLQLREYADLLTRYVEDLDSARDRAAVTNEELANRLAEQLNNRLYLLAVVATIFLPLGFLTGLLGINVGGIPGADSAAGFVIVIVLLAAVGVIEYLVLKWLKWF
jgi:zinc transporter